MSVGDLFAIMAGVGALAWSGASHASLRQATSADGEPAGTAAPVPDPTAPRGIRNNNPLNIEYTGDQWRGLDDPPTDGRYCRFVDPRWGFRAAAVILGKYAGRDPDVLTVPEIIKQWAPSFENDTQGYITSVLRRSGLTDSQPITRAEYPVLLEAMAYHENGQQPYAATLIIEGVSWA